MIHSSCAHQTSVLLYHILLQHNTGHICAAVVPRAGTARAANPACCITPVGSHAWLMYKWPQMRDEKDAQGQGCVHRQGSVSVSGSG